MPADRFHKAAKDGLLEVLKEATRKDANAKDEDSMTPVLWAAFEGHLEALRLLCGRGGDPDKCDQFGNTALHLSSAKGHLRCVDFLVKFGVNIYALDIDKHSAKDLAAINNRDEILRYLDAATAKFEATERKKSRAMKELAEKNCEKRIKEYMKRQQKQDLEQQRETKASPPPKSGKMLSTLKQKIWSSQGNLHKLAKDPSPPGSSAGVKFSELVQTGNASSCGGSIASRQGKSCSKAKGCSGMDSGGFKIGEMEPNGRRTITSLSGVQRDSEVLYVGTFSSNEDNCKRGKINGLFEVDEVVGNSDSEAANNKCNYGTLSRSYSQPDILGDSEGCDTLRPELPRPCGLFDRPMLGSIAFRRSVTAALSQLNTDVYSGVDHSTTTTTMVTQPSTRANSISSKTRAAKQRSFLNLTDSDSDGGADVFSDDEEQDVAGGPIQRFLTVWGLEEYLAVFQKQQIDLDTLLLLTEADLKSLGLPLGPFRKLSFAIQERKNALSNPGAIRDSHL